MEDIKMEESYKPEMLGICPKCKTGNLVKGTLGYTCNHFKSNADKCTFTIFSSYFGKEITEDIALQLIENGETEIFTDLVKKDGGTFTASFRYEEGFIKPNFKNRVMGTKCPVCGDNVEEVTNGFACVSYLKKDEKKKCGFYVPKKIASRPLMQKEIDCLLNGQKTGFLDGFINKKNETFTCRLMLDDSGTVIFDSTLCQCPKCGGNMHIGKKAYNCSNFHNEEIKCDFSIWREISYREISPEEAIDLCEKRITPTLSGFRNKNGNFERKLLINDDFNVIMI